MGFLYTVLIIIVIAGSSYLILRLLDKASEREKKIENDIALGKKYTNISELTLNELKQLAKERKIKNYMTIKLSELFDQLDDIK